jgi:hypothetical protein
MPAPKPKLPQGRRLPNSKMRPGSTAPPAKNIVVAGSRKKIIVGGKKANTIKPAGKAEPKLSLEQQRHMKFREARNAKAERKNATTNAKLELRQEGANILRFLKAQGLNAGLVEVRGGGRSHNVTVRTAFSKYVFKITREEVMGRKASVHFVSQGVFHNKANRIRIGNALSAFEEARQS